MYYVEFQYNLCTAGFLDALLHVLLRLLSDPCDTVATRDSLNTAVVISTDRLLAAVSLDS
jgi:hypothetical protein